MNREAYAVRDEDEGYDPVVDAGPDGDTEGVEMFQPRVRKLWGATWDNLSRAQRELESV